MKFSIGLIGAGRMGKSYGLNLLKAGYEVLVYDVNPQAVTDLIAHGSRSMRNPNDVAKRSQYLLIAVPRSEIVEELILGANGILPDMQKDATIIDMSTTSPDVTIRIARACSGRVHFLDAPVSGHPERADQGTLTIMVGGEEKVFEAAKKHIFLNLGENIFHAGPCGAGQSLKLVNNLMYNINRLAMCEGFIMGHKAGIDPDVMLKVISLSSGAIYAVQKNGLNLLMHNFEGNESSLALACKTLKLIIDYGHQLGSCLLLGNVVKQIYDLARLKYGADLNPIAAVKFYEEVPNSELITDKKK